MRFIILSAIVNNVSGHPFIMQEYTTVDEDEELSEFIIACKRLWISDGWTSYKMVMTELTFDELKGLMNDATTRARGLGRNERGSDGRDGG